MRFEEKIRSGNYTHSDVEEMLNWFDVARANEKMLEMDRDNAEKREYEVLGRANALEAELKGFVTYKNMFEQAVRTLAAIDDALGLDDDGCNEPERTLEAIAELKAKAARGEDLARTVMADNTGNA